MFLKWLPPEPKAAPIFYRMVTQTTLATWTIWKQNVSWATKKLLNVYKKMGETLRKLNPHRSNNRWFTLSWTRTSPFNCIDNLNCQFCLNRNQLFCRFWRCCVFDWLFFLVFLWNILSRLRILQINISQWKPHITLHLRPIWVTSTLKLKATRLLLECPGYLVVNHCQFKEILSLVSLI